MIKCLPATFPYIIAHHNINSKTFWQNHLHNDIKVKHKFSMAMEK